MGWAYEDDDELSDDEIDAVMAEEIDIVPSGMGVRVPLMHMDHRTAAGALPRLHDGMGNPAGFKPGFAFATTTPLQDGQREDMLKRHRNQLSEAWRNPRPQPVVDDESVDDKAGKRKSYTALGGQSFQQLSGDALFEKRKAQLSNAWQSPPGMSSQASHERRRLSEAWRRR